MLDNKSMELSLDMYINDLYWLEKAKIKYSNKTRLTRAETDVILRILEQYCSIKALQNHSYEVQVCYSIILIESEIKRLKGELDIE